jgi:pyruvate-ferredoxin/flavodoxin oxidoreductase
LILSLLQRTSSFLDGEVRYLSLKLKNPERAAKLNAAAAQHAKEHRAYLEKLVTLYGKD